MTGVGHQNNKLSVPADMLFKRVNTKKAPAQHSVVTQNSSAFWNFLLIVGFVTFIPRYYVRFKIAASTVAKVRQQLSVMKQTTTNQDKCGNLHRLLQA